MLLTRAKASRTRISHLDFWRQVRRECVLEVTQTHIHIHTHTFTPWRVPRGGGLEGRHAHGELEAHGGSGEEYGSCVRENDGCRDSRAMVCKEGAGGGPREAIPGGVMGGRRACELTKRSQGAVEGGGASAPVVSVTSRALGPPGDRGAGRPCSRDRGSLGPNRCPWRAAKGHRPVRALCGQELQMCGNSSYDDKFTHRYRYRCLFTEMFPERRPRINSQFTPQMDVPVCSTGTCERHHERRPRPRGSSTRSRVRQTGARRS